MRVRSAHHARLDPSRQVYEVLFLGDLAKGVRGGREDQGVCRVLMNRGGETAVRGEDLSGLGEIECGANLVGAHRDGLSLSGCSWWSTVTASAGGPLSLGVVRAQSSSTKLVLSGSPGGEHSHVSRETWEWPAVEAVLRPVYCTRCAVHGVHRGSVGLLKLVVLRFVKVGPAAGAASSPDLEGGLTAVCVRYC